MTAITCRRMRWKLFWALVREALCAIGQGIGMVMLGSTTWERLRYGQQPPPTPRPTGAPAWLEQDRFERACEVIAGKLPDTEPERSREIHRRVDLVEAILDGRA